MKDRQIGIALDLEEPYPHHQDVFAGVMAYARQRPGWRCVIDEHPGAKARQRKLDRSHYDGIIARADSSIQRAAKRLKVPMVNVQYEHHKPGMATVRIDTEATGTLTAEHLLNRGYSRLGVLISGRGKNRQDITKAFSQCVEEHGKSCDIQMLPEGSPSDVAYWVRMENFLKQWIDQMQPPVGLFIESTITARLLVEMAHELGLRVPQDLAVLCYENSVAMDEVSTQLSAIENNYVRFGYEAAELLDRMMDGGAVPKKPILIPPKGIIARASTDYFAVEDELVANALYYISEHLGRKLTVDSIAYELAVSPRTLQSRFDAALGHGVGAEIRRLRLAAVKVMLGEPDLTMASIALKVGFASPAVMSQTFLRELGLSPSAFRKQRLSEKLKRQARR